MAIAKAKKRWGLTGINLENRMKRTMTAIAAWHKW